MLDDACQYMGLCAMTNLELENIAHMLLRTRDRRRSITPPTIWSTSFGFARGGGGDFESVYGDTYKNHLYSKEILSLGTRIIGE